jgi:hypothetical protein
MTWCRSHKEIVYRRQQSSATFGGLELIDLTGADSSPMWFSNRRQAKCYHQCSLGTAARNTSQDV